MLEAEVDTRDTQGSKGTHGSGRGQWDVKGHIIR